VSGSSVTILAMAGRPAEPASAAITTKPDYGIDAPGVVRNLYLAFVAGIGVFATARSGLWSGVAFHVDFANFGLFGGLGCGLMGTWMLYDSMVGKVRERERLLDLVELRGTDHVLDVGCGRGLLLIGAARRLTTGRATGIDLWSSVDLSGNTAAATLENARRESVAERVHVETGDMRRMPFADATFDVVVSNAAIHNISDREGRNTAIREIGRVLKAGGRLVINDIRHVDQYAAELTKLGFAQVTRRGSAALRWFLMLVTWGALRPDILTARR